MGGWQGRAWGSMPARRDAPEWQREMEPLEPPPSRRLDARDALDTPPPFSSGTVQHELSPVALARDANDDILARDDDAWPVVHVSLEAVRVLVPRSHSP